MLFFFLHDTNNVIMYNVWHIFIYLPGVSIYVTIACFVCKKRKKKWATTGIEDAKHK